MTEISDINITNEMAQKIAAPMELDLEAVFNLNFEAVMIMLEKAARDGTTPEEFIQEVEQIFDTGEDVSRIEKGGTMPIPDPKPGESQDKYISRCMSAQGEDSTPEDQKLAICYDKYRNASKSAFMQNVEDLTKRLKGKNG